MRVTSFKDVETYLYSSVIIPLKGMNVRPLEVPSPITSNDRKRAWEFMVRPEPLRRRYRRNYQNTQAQRKANLQIVLWTGKKEHIVATYHTKNHWVKVYERPFKILKAVPLMGILYKLLDTNTPFTKVISALDPPVQGVYRNRSGEIAERSPIDDGDMEGYEEDDY